MLITLKKLKGSNSSKKKRQLPIINKDKPLSSNRKINHQIKQNKLQRQRKRLFSLEVVALQVVGKDLYLHKHKNPTSVNSKKKLLISINRTHHLQVPRNRT